MLQQQSAIGGTGYSAGDVLTVSATNTGGFGKNLELSIPNNVGVISAFNTLVLNNIQGKPKVDSSSVCICWWRRNQCCKWWRH